MRGWDEPPRAKPAGKVLPVLPDEPPPEAEEKCDGSFCLVLNASYCARWTKRKDGSWRKPEHLRADAADVLQNGQRLPAPSIEEATAGAAAGAEQDKAAALKAAKVKERMDKAAAIAEQVELFTAIGCPPIDAKKQPDASYVLELEDKSTLRWTRRPNGTWRKAEHKKAGWVGELEREKYVIPRERIGGSNGGNGSNSRQPLDDFDYGRAQMAPQRPALVVSPTPFALVTEDFPDLLGAQAPSGGKARGRGTGNQAGLQSYY